MVTPTVTDQEKAFLLQALGSLALPKDDMSDLRYKFYDGVVKGTLSLGGGPNSAQPIPVGRTMLLSRSGNSTGKMPVTQGNEYAFGYPFPAGTYDQFQVETGIAGGAGATMRIGIRPIDMATGLIGAPIGEHTIDLTAIGIRSSVGSPIVLQNKVYAVTYVRYNDTGDLCQIQKGMFSINPSLIPLQYNNGLPATGHAPYVAFLNSGIAGALPSTVVTNNVGANVDGNEIPQIGIRRSA